MKLDLKNKYNQKFVYQKKTIKNAKIHRKIKI